MDKGFSLSVIIPAKNEDKNICRCLESVVQATCLIKNTEMILVDSASTDKTVEKADCYPVKILRLKPVWFLSASAARHIGTFFASGEFIFFLDADMTLEASFLEKAMAFLSQDKKIAGAGGIGKEIYLKEEEETGIKPNLYNTPGLVKKVNFLGGAGLYRASALREVGSFNPYLRAAEEIELAQRLRQKKYSLVSLPEPMINHYTAPLGKWEEFIRKKKSGLFIGIGEALRICRTLKYLWENLFYYKTFTLFILFALYAAMILTCAMLLASLKFTSLILLPLLIVFLYLLFKKGSFKIAGLSLIKWLILSLDITYGLSLSPSNPDGYPKDPDILRGNFNVEK